MNLDEFFIEHNKVALAFSGGVDSAYLLYEAVQAKADVCAYYVKTAFQPQFEYEDALRLVSELGASMKVIQFDVLESKTITDNPKDRCYYCKNAIFSKICQQAKEDGYEVILDGTNASDDAADRPGMKALEELCVRSPLRECGLTKDMIRQRSREAGLFTWDKPAYACLATRIPCGELITAEKLKRTEIAEEYLASLGFVDFRVRTMANSARIQVREEQFLLAIEQKDAIRKALKEYYDFVMLDMEGRA